MDIYLWLAVGIVSFVVELLTVGLISIWFVLGALVALLLALLDLHIAIQVVAFAVVSLICIFCFRNYWVKHLKDNFIPTNLDAYVGKEVVVFEEINDSANTGIIKINGQLWSAKSIDGTVYAVNEKVIVDKLVGNTIYVKKGDI